MSALLYNAALPVAQKSVYNPGDMIEWALSFPGQAVVLNSLRVSGTLTVNFAQNADVRYDSRIGIVGFFNQWAVVTARQGTIENRAFAPRWAAMVRASTTAPGDIITSARITPELTAPSDMASTVLLTNKGVVAAGRMTVNPIEFSTLVPCCLNNAVSGDGSPPLLDYARTGDLRVSCRINTPIEALYGAGFDAATTFTIGDLRLEYSTTGSSGRLPPVSLMTTIDVKQVINSNNAQISVSLPIQAVGVSCSFARVADELTAAASNTALVRPPGISRVVFSFSDQTSGILGFPLDTPEAILEAYMNSFGAPLGKHSFTAERLTAADSYGVGLPFPGAGALASTVGINLETAITGADAYYIYCFYRGAVTL